MYVIFIQARSLIFILIDSPIIVLVHTNCFFFFLNVLAPAPAVCDNELQLEVKIIEIQNGYTCIYIRLYYKDTI